MATYLLNEHQLRLLAEMAGDEEIETPLDANQSDELLKFSGVKTGNSKIAHPSFSLPAGHTCKFAKDCKSCADRDTGKLTDNPELRFRCFAATQENYLTSLRRMRWHNYDLLRKTKSVDEMADLIDRSFKVSFPKAIPVLRLHVGGDFYDQAYFAAWMEMARRHPNMVIYAYTKALPFWVKHKDVIPSNFRLTASVGGTHDYLIDTEKLKSSRVVFSQEEADALGLKVDHDDSNAAFGDESFATMLHGTQPPKSDASKARMSLHKTGFTGYGDKGKKAKKLKEGKTYLISEYHYEYLREVLSEVVQPLSSKDRAALTSGGYDVSLQIDQNGYDFILDLLSDRALGVFNTKARTLTNRDLSPDVVSEKIKSAGLKMNRVRKPEAPRIKGSLGDRYRSLAVPKSGENIRAKINKLRYTNAVDKFDRANADVKIDSWYYGDGGSSHHIEPLSVKWKKLFGGKKFTVDQDRIGQYLSILDREGAVILAEEVQK